MGFFLTMLFGFELQTAEWGLNMMTTGAFTLREAERRAKQVQPRHSTMSGGKVLASGHSAVPWLADAALPWNRH